MSNSNEVLQAVKDGLRHVESETRQYVDRKINDALASKGRLTPGVQLDGDNTREIHKDLIRTIGAEHHKFLAGTPFQTKEVGVMTLGSNLTGSTVVSYVENPIMRSFYNPHLYDSFRIIPTNTGNVSFPRGANPLGEGSFGAQVEGQEKAQLHYDLTMVNVSVPFIAGYAKVSRQMLQDLPFLQAYLSSSLIEDWNRCFNNRAMATITASATPGSSIATPVAERIVDYITQHMELGLGRPDLILTTHAVWSEVLKTVPSGGGYSVPGGVSIAADGTIRVLGIPLVPHSQIPADKIYVMNRSAFAIAQASGLSVRSTETDQDDFIKNLVTYRCEARVELISFQPTAAVYGTAS